MHTHSNFLCKMRWIKSRIYETCSVCPFIWDQKIKLYTSNKKLKAYFYRESLIVPFLTIYQTYQLLQFTSEHKLNDIIFLSLVWLVNILITANTYIYIWKLDEYLGYINGTILLGDQIARKFFKKIIFPKYK